MNHSFSCCMYTFNTYFNTFKIFVQNTLFSLYTISVIRGIFLQKVSRRELLICGIIAYHLYCIIQSPFIWGLLGYRKCPYRSCHCCTTSAEFLQESYNKYQSQTPEENYQMLGNKKTVQKKLKQHCSLNISSGVIYLQGFTLFYFLRRIMKDLYKRNSKSG